ncbi:ATP-binding protein [Clostridium sp. OS1-26]|uniref:ATP-binding protein n=1 Tax=Clostridium sp. OS1-26 TaxID=3070681 RepID=UPI0027E06CDF|nr:ATP-binding protein [Clostridium sp. OS1-26]WML33430.1 ATP-binding protein [Clostridium sp. OS1-26]
MNSIILISIILEMIKISNNLISMEPYKDIFINILTRDIDFKDAILDLVDNSIDAAKKTRKTNDLTNFEIKITIDKSKFVINDNCGGISIDTATESAFRFGNDKTSSHDDQSVGRFGIGMKRATFKIGNMITVESATEKEYFKVIIDVFDWQKQKDWDIKFKQVTENKNKTVGTTIKVTNLKEDTIRKFTQGTFIVALEESIREKHSDALENGIRITLNNSVIDPLPKEKQVKVAELKIKEKGFTGSISVYKAECNKKLAGWYIKFNNRVIIKADKSQLTGWGLSKIRDKMKTEEFEERFSSFRGYVDLIDTKARMLPFNTTKNSVNKDSEEYEKILDYMVEAMNKSIPHFRDLGLKCISYKRPVEQVTKLMKLLDLKYAKDVGEYTYDQYIKNNNIK